jgi:RIO kinase 1
MCQHRKGGRFELLFPHQSDSVAYSVSSQANVYHGTSPSTPPVSSNPSSPYPSPYPDSIALKVYKTSILSFKSRSAYMVGEHRLKNAYTAVSNPRKMVRTWAEKELRNLRRLGAGGINAPRVVEVRENVLVMEFLGDVDGK